MRQPSTVVALAALVFLAGCGGMLGSDTRTADAPNPGAVPTDDPMADPPDGLSEAGITDEHDLYAANTRGLANRSYTLRSNQTVTAANGTVLTEYRSTSRTTTNHSLGFQTVRFEANEAPFSALDRWQNTTHVTQRVVGPDGQEYSVYECSPSQQCGFVGSPNFQRLLALYQRAESSSVTSSGGDIELRFSAPRNQSVGYSGAGAVDVTSQTVTVTLTESGRLDEYRVEFSGRLVGSGTTVDGVAVVQVADVGATDVERPDWVSTARNASTA
ncbi:DUF7537 family lipoprotein [Halomarina rubra]|uniref:Lipoprotein n=1 Tax=Halomarina rubra TaxID=2071873 RepID=A0ABD6B1I1_9EURY|nr:hypothetical protein [Halomarina rubra]